MKQDYSCGVIPYRLNNGRREFLLIQHLAGHWSFPKGHPEDSESPLQAAEREFREETGISGCKVQATPAFEESYSFVKRSGKQVRKRVTYYLGAVDVSAAVRVQPEEIADHMWADAASTRLQITFEEGRSLFDEVVSYLDTHATA